MSTIRLSRVTLEYAQYGEGPERILFTHGFLSSGRIWRLVQEALPADRYTSIAVFNRGAGASEAPPELNDFGVEVFASDLFELVTAKGWREFTLVGHSLGGATATRFALDHPELVKGLVLLAPADPDGVKMSDGLTPDRAIESLLAAIPGQSTAYNLDADASDVPEALMRELGRDIAGAPERRLRASLASVFGQRMGAAARSLPMPVLLCGGDVDRMIPAETLISTWMKYPPGTGLHVWHGVGHSPNLDRASELAALICAFIERTVPARRLQPQPA